MDSNQGFPEWTELGQDSGLDPLGMQRPIEAIFQSIVPGISTITIRYRYYSFYPFILKHYEENIRHSDPAVFRIFQRRCEALFALICAYGDSEFGIAGTNWAKRTLNQAHNHSRDIANIDFSVGSDPDSTEEQRYLRNKGGAFGAIYATQMAEMGLLHLPGAGDPNPNPVCSDIALKLADALSNELGAAASEFFKAVETGKVSFATLKSLGAMKPNHLKFGSDEHKLLTEILLGKLDTSGEADLRRRSTLRMLLEVVATSAKIPPVEQIKWRWFEKLPEPQRESTSTVPHLWFLYQACDLMRLAYEAILVAALTMLERKPQRRLSLEGLTNELVSYVSVADDQTWEELSLDIADGAVTAREHAQAMLEAIDLSETAQQVHLAVSLIAALFVRALDMTDLVEETMSGSDYFQSLRTEVQFLNQARSAPARHVIADMFRERVIKRHLWVAARKFRNQNAYTFHMEPDEGQLRYRSHFSVSPSSPRLTEAIRFLCDIGLIDDGGITQFGLAELAAT